MSEDWLTNSTQQSTWEINGYSSNWHVHSISMWRFRAMFTKANHLSLSWARWTQSTPSHPSSFIWILTLIFIFNLDAPSSPYPISSSYNNFVCIYLVFHISYMSHPSYLLWFGNPNNIWWRVQITKLIISNFFSLLLLPHMSKHSPQCPILQYPQSIFFTGYLRPCSTPM